jgi:NADH-quinone oxidoreductase subunit M
MDGLNDGWSWNFYSTMSVLAATGVVLGAVYMLWSYQRVFFGKITKAENHNLRDVTPTEMAFSAPMIAMIFLLGVAPGWFLNRTQDAMKGTLTHTLESADKIQDANANRVQVRNR